MTVNQEQLAEYDRLDAALRKALHDYNTHYHPLDERLDQAREELNQFLAKLGAAAIKEAREAKK
jgi:hypothetical protein